jgi:hypothetical protein
MSAARERRQLREAVAARLVEEVYQNFLEQFGSADDARSTALTPRGVHRRPVVPQRTRRFEPPPWDSSVALSPRLIDRAPEPSDEDGEGGESGGEGADGDGEGHFEGNDFGYFGASRGAGAGAAAASDGLRFIDLEALDGDLPYAPTAAEIEQARNPVDLEVFPRPFLEDNLEGGNITSLTTGALGAHSEGPGAGDFEPDFLRKYFYSERRPARRRRQPQQASPTGRQKSRTGPPEAEAQAQAATSEPAVTLAFGSPAPGTSTRPQPLRRKSQPVIVKAGPRNKCGESAVFAAGLQKELSRAERKDVQNREARARRERAAQYARAARLRNAAAITNTASAGRLRSAGPGRPKVAGSGSRAGGNTNTTATTATAASSSSEQHQRRKKATVPRLSHAANLLSQKKKKKPGPERVPRPIIVSDYPNTYAEDHAASERKRAARERDAAWIDPSTLLDRMEELEALAHRFERRANAARAGRRVDAAFKRVERQAVAGEMLLRSVA